MAQLDSARLCLNALVAEHVFGSQEVILDILLKHYRLGICMHYFSNSSNNSGIFCFFFCYFPFFCLLYSTSSIFLFFFWFLYRSSLWRQFHKLIGSTDLVEGSVGLVANLGTGVYDLFYEPIDGLLDENGSFLSGGAGS